MKLGSRDTIILPSARYRVARNSALFIRPTCPRLEAGIVTISYRDSIDGSCERNNEVGDAEEGRKR